MLLGRVDTLLMPIYDYASVAKGGIQEDGLFSARKRILLKSQILDLICANYNYRQSVITSFIILHYLSCVYKLDWARHDLHPSPKF